MHMQRACFTARATTRNGRLRNALQQTSQSPTGPQGRLAHHARCLLHVCGAGAPATAASIGGGAGMTHDQLLAEFAKLIPILDGRSYKGQHGKVGVVGGSVEYTGAPFFAAQSAMLVGADMSYVMAMPEAAPVIKAFSPDMMVLPWLPPSSDALESAAERDPHVAAVAEEERQIRGCKARFAAFRPRVTSLVVGPGLGAQPSVAAAAAGLISIARNTNLPFLVDGSGITSVVAAPHRVAVGEVRSGPDAMEVVQGCRLAVLTPNVAELGRIAAKLDNPLPGHPNTQWQQHAQKVASLLGGPVLVAKGPHDIITDGRVTLVCAAPAALKRCGGQGDLVAGVTGTFLSWAAQAQAEYNEQVDRRQVDPAKKPSPFLLAAYAGCTVVRNASSAAYSVRRRAMLTPDILEALPAAFEATFPRK